MAYKKVQFDHASTTERELLIAMLAEIGFDGFEEEENILNAYIHNSEFHRGTLDDVSARIKIPYIITELPDKNWNEVWESNFAPVVVEDFCAVRADFHEPIANVMHEIVITPKMSFGTGHHATTFMMMQQMQQINFRGRHVLDFGTGTGVLAILADKCGAATVVAVDNDDWSINNARENFERNNCSTITLVKADTAAMDEQFDVILANITRNVIMQNFSHFIDHLSARGVLLLSGLLADDEMDISKKAAEYNLTLDTKTEKNNWLSLRFQKP
jgi:ribosomal protein L11 methyltransferase